MQEEMTVRTMCPIDQTTLVMTERQGVEVNYCPTWRGIWLAGSELVRMIEISRTKSSSQDRYRDDDTDRRIDRTEGGMLGKVSQALGQRSGRHDAGTDHHGRSRKKKESFLEELFNF